MLRLSAFSLTLLCSQAFAAGPTILGASGASGTNLTGTPVVYGSIAGPSCTPNNVGETCDSCAVTPICDTTPLCACNKTRLLDSGIVTLSLKLPDGVTGNARVRTTTGSVDLNVLNPNNGGTSVSLNWSEVCQNMPSPGTCESFISTQTVTLKVYIDKTDSTTEEGTDVQFKVVAVPDNTYDVYGTQNSDGIGAFEPFPGDEKVYIDNPQSTGTYPTMGYGIAVSKLKVMFSDVNLTDATLNAPFEPQDIDILENGEFIGKNIVDGLENEKTYYFRIALVDQANNIVQYYPGLTVTDAGCTTTPGTLPCAYAATPSQVLGLLSKDLNCFIATAAYGSPLEPKLRIFRDFRYKILLPREWGLSFVKFYYEYGPYAARYISDKPVLRALTRGALWPLYGFSYLSLKVGLPWALTLSLMLLSALLVLPWLGVRRVLRRE